VTGPVVVELCGLPGSGKTTLAAALQRLLTDRGIACRIADHGISAAVPPHRRTMRRVWHASVAAGTDPGWATESAQRFISVRNRSARDNAATLVQWLAVADLIRTARHAPGVNLLEEGLVQTAWTLLLRSHQSLESFDPRQLFQAVPPVAHSDLVLVVDVPVRMAADRLAGRSSMHSRTQLLPAEQRLTELRRGGALLDLLLRVVPTSVHRLCVLPGLSPAELAAEAADSITGRWDVTV
jgi:energy-coupling factor transporter ATP-binding protein EcfA2